MAIFTPREIGQRFSNGRLTLLNVKSVEKVSAFNLYQDIHISFTDPAWNLYISHDYLVVGKKTMGGKVYISPPKNYVVVKAILSHTSDGYIGRKDIKVSNDKKENATKALIKFIKATVGITIDYKI
jgi:hypothetical protein